MTTNRALESYLNQLNKALNSLSVSDRAEIITEIKGHVLEAIETNPNQSIDSVLNSLGSPEQVANRYLLERGIKPHKAPIHPFFKWTVIGFLGTFAMILIFAAFVISSFSPLIEVNEKEGRVQLLGGLIDVDEDEGFVSIAGQKEFFSGKNKIEIEGDYDSDQGSPVKLINVNFSNGKYEFSPSVGRSITWRCKATGGERATENIGVGKKGEFNLNLSNYKGSKCEVGIPQRMNVKVTGGNGKIEVDRPTSNYDINVGNGKVEISPDPTQKYKLDANVVNGYLENFQSSDDKDALMLKVSLTNGKLEFDD